MDVLLEIFFDLVACAGIFRGSTRNSIGDFFFFSKVESSFCVEFKES